MESLYVNTRRAAELLGVSASWLEKARVFGGGPKFVKIGGPNGRVLYEVSALHAWTRSLVHGSTSEYAHQADQQQNESKVDKLDAAHSPKCSVS